MFKWSCFALAFVAVVSGLWMIYDIRCDTKVALHRINEDLPQVLSNARTSTETLKDLSADIKAMRELAGVTTGGNESFVGYANQVMKVIEKAGPNAQIGVFRSAGEPLKSPEPAGNWLVHARKEAVILVLKSNSKEEILRGLCRTLIMGNKIGIKIGDAPAMPLEEYVKKNHPESSNLKLD